MLAHLVILALSAVIAATQPPAPSSPPAPVTQGTAVKPVRLPLAGRTIGIDPGHNGGNGSDPAYLGQQIWNGRESEDCDTAGAQSAGGYTEAQFNWNVAADLVKDLRAEGAKIVLTRHSNTGLGPCVDTRAHIIDNAHAAVAIDIHADGGPSGGRGFAVLEPVRDGPNNGVIHASEIFGAAVVRRFRAVTGMPVSTYDGTDGVALRDDLAGLNLTTVPKVLIECGNMTNGTDAAMLESHGWQKRAATALAEAITAFVARRHG